VPVQPWAYEAGGSAEAGRVIEPRNMSSRGQQDSRSGSAAKAAGLQAPAGNHPGGDTGEDAGYHRGLRAGPVCSGGTRERGRTPGLRASCPAWGPGRPKARACPGGFDQARSPRGTPRTQRRRRGIGQRTSSAAPRDGQGVVGAAHRTGAGGAPRPTGPTGGQATPGITFVCKDLWERLRAHPPYP
jgi:hypothetical protein